MGPYREKEYPLFLIVAVLLVVLAAIYWPWISPARELFRQEGLYAVMAEEFKFSSFLVTAHQVGIRNAYPLFPAAARGIQLFTHWPLEAILRGISVAGLLATALVAFSAAASIRDRKAGLVAASVVLTPLIALEKGALGTPVSTSAFLLLSAQMVLFYYGVRRSDWSRGWLLSLAIMTIAFWCGGFRVLFFFFFPMIFFRRPLSGTAKFRKVGFALGLLLLGAAIAAWIASFVSAYNQIPLDYSGLTRSVGKDFLENLWSFPLTLPIRLLPWSLIAWLPFCVALQALDRTPVFGAYLRTLLLSTLLLLWILPECDTQEIFYALGPLAILVGSTYELGMRRYGERVRRFLALGDYLPLVITVVLLVFWYGSAELIGRFASIASGLGFRSEKLLFILLAVTALAGLFYIFGRRRQPVYLSIWALVVFAGVIHSGISAHYEMQEQAKRQFGAAIAVALADEHPQILYKSGIQDLYSPLYYAHVPVAKLTNLAALPAEEPRVYLLSDTFPLKSDRIWVNLLPGDFTYHGHPLGLWRGTAAEKTSEE